MREVAPDIVGADRTANAAMVLVCEHASAAIPPEFGDLGLAPDARFSHAAWDPGALDLARALADLCAAPLVAGAISRLVYDCNRPPGAADAIPERSEIHEVPGNRGLSGAAKAARAAAVHAPFHAALAELLRRAPGGALVTIHSFTPVWRGARRDFGLGVLHDADSRLADALLKAAPADMDARRNAPYGPEDGVTHTLRLHALPAGRLNVMLEIRNDLIATPEAARRYATRLAPMLAGALAKETAS